MMFLDCAWMKQTLEKSLDDVLSARDEEMIKEMVIRLLAYYAKQSDNAVDDLLVELVRSRLMMSPGLFLNNNNDDDASKDDDVHAPSVPPTRTERV